VDKTYKVYWSQTGLNELANMLAYPPEVKERIFNYSFTQLCHTPTLTAKQANSIWQAGRLLGKTWTLSSNSNI